MTETTPAKNTITHSQNPTLSTISTLTPSNTKDYLKSTVNSRLLSVVGLINLKGFWIRQEKAKLIFSWSIRICKLKTEKSSIARLSMQILHQVMMRKFRTRIRRMKQDREGSYNYHHNSHKNNRRWEILVILLKNSRKGSNNLKDKTTISRTTLEKTKNYVSRTQQQEHQN